MHDRAMQHLKPARTRGFADDDVRHVILVRTAQDVVGEAPRRRRDGDGLALQSFSQSQRLRNAIPFPLGKLQAPPRLHIKGRTRRVESVGKSLGVWRVGWGAGVLVDV